MQKRRRILLLLIAFFYLVLLPSGCGSDTAPSPTPMDQEAEAGPEMGSSSSALQLTSTAFNAGAPIPPKYTCDGEDISPPLAWTGAPQNTLSFALIADDPDAPRGTWVHWVLYNIPAEIGGLPEAVPPDTDLADGSQHGQNSWKRPGYGGPCPPGGTHRYFFKLYALDKSLDLDAGAGKDELLAAMEGHIVAQGELMGTYARQ